jgi:hypothetical protein
LWARLCGLRCLTGLGGPHEWRERKVRALSFVRIEAFKTAKRLGEGQPVCKWQLFSSRSTNKYGGEIINVKVSYGCVSLLVLVSIVALTVGCGKAYEPHSPFVERLLQLQSKADKGNADDKITYVEAVIENRVLLSGDCVEVFELKRFIQEAQKLGHPDAARLHAHIGNELQRNADYFAAMNDATSGDAKAFLEVAMILLYSDAIWLPENAKWLQEARQYAKSASSAGNDGGTRLLEYLRLMEGYREGRASGIQPSELIAQARDMAARARHPMLLALAEQMALEARAKNEPGAVEILQQIAKAQEKL